MGATLTVSSHRSLLSADDRQQDAPGGAFPPPVPPRVSLHLRMPAGARARQWWRALGDVALLTFWSSDTSVADGLENARRQRKCGDRPKPAPASAESVLAIQWNRQSGRVLTFVAAMEDGRHQGCARRGAPDVSGSRGLRASMPGGAALRPRSAPRGRSAVRSPPRAREAARADNAICAVTMTTAPVPGTPRARGPRGSRSSTL